MLSFLRARAPTVALAALLAATAARAQIIYWDPEDLTMGDEHAAVALYFSSGDLTAEPTSMPDLIFGTYGVPIVAFIPGLGVANEEANVLRLSAGDVIDSRFTYAGAALGEGSEAVIFNLDGTGAQWSFGNRGYLGYFDGLHYGWVGLTYDQDEGRTLITIHDFAYHSTPGQAILAGQTAAIPEPSTYAALAGLLAISTAFLRRRSVAA